LVGKVWHICIWQPVISDSYSPDIPVDIVPCISVWLLPRSSAEQVFVELKSLRWYSCHDRERLWLAPFYLV
jgi:hypothetical protein